MVVSFAEPVARALIKDEFRVMTIDKSIEHPGAVDERHTELAEGCDSTLGRGQMPSNARGADLEIIIPTLNEEARIGPVLQALVDYLGCQSWRSSVVIVDNGCTDRTLEVADSVSCADVSVRVIGCRDRGKGAAVRRRTRSAL